MPSDSQRPLSLYRRGGQSPYIDRSILIEAILHFLVISP